MALLLVKKGEYIYGGKKEKRVRHDARERGIRSRAMRTVSGGSDILFYTLGNCGEYLGKFPFILFKERHPKTLQIGCKR